MRKSLCRLRYRAALTLRIVLVGLAYVRGLLSIKAQIL
jgi:hypothetical protein